MKNKNWRGTGWSGGGGDRLACRMEGQYYPNIKMMMVVVVIVVPEPRRHRRRVQQQEQVERAAEAWT